MFKHLKFILVLVLSIVFLSLIFAQEAKDLVEIGKDINIQKGKVVNNVIAIGGDVRVNGTVLRDLVSVGGTVHLRSAANVKGSVISVGGSVVKNRGAKVGDSVVEKDVADFMTFVDRIPHRQIFKIAGYMKSLAILIIGLIIVALMPNFIGGLSFSVENNFKKVLLRGITGALLAIPIALMLLISVIGILLLPIYFFCIVVAVLIGKVVVAQLVGKRLFAALKYNNVNILWETFLGLIVVLLLLSIPVFGFLINLIIVFLGIGSILLYKFNS